MCFLPEPSYPLEALGRDGDRYCSVEVYGEEHAYRDHKGWGDSVFVSFL